MDVPYHELDLATLNELLDQHRANLALWARQDAQSGPLDSRVNLKNQMDYAKQAIEAIRAELDRRATPGSRSRPQPKRQTRSRQPPESQIASDLWWMGFLALMVLPISSLALFFALVDTNIRDNLNAIDARWMIVFIIIFSFLVLYGYVKYEDTPHPLRELVRLDRRIKFLKQQVADPRFEHRIERYQEETIKELGMSLSEWKAATGRDHPYGLPLSAQHTPPE